MQPDPYKFMRDTLAATDVTRTYRELIASMQMNLKAQDIATLSSGQAMRDAIALSSGQTMRDAIAAMDVTRSYETLLFSKNMSTSVFDQLAGLEVSQSYNQLIAGFDATKSVHDMLSRLDVARTYRELIAELDTVTPFRETVAKLDIDSTYRHMFDAIDTGVVLRNFATGIDVAKVVCEAIAALDQDPASPDSLDQLTGQLNAAYDWHEVSEADRYAIATYVGILAFALCVWFYFAHPEAAHLAIDSSAPAAWALALARFVYCRLGQTED